ncbi:type II secretion system F family protein [Alginatibacterium sediminis]|uniref:Type II secretion system F family protein n=1 Tax=Alginatibacterium sediminis TaxID=2164068 RepID=A0A420EL00_9ALTE|nr:type II secretion system F family protein [Alginatibacterium sediminis]RKF21375.1 type II secretion system F family protein [Alginatibacterium sediminis]
MPLYRYSARDQSGKLVSGEMEQGSENLVADNLVRRNLIPISITMGSSKTESNIDFKELLQRRVSIEEMVVFSRQMYSLAKAGIPIMRAVGGLAESTSNERLKKALDQIFEGLSSGRTLSASMAEHPKVFSQLFVSIVHVGENTGRLEQSFLQLSQYLELEMDTRKRIKTAMRYPSFVVLSIVAALVILNIFVIPKFADIFGRFNAELPLATRILIGTSNFFVHYWPLLLILIVVSFIGFNWWLRQEKGRLTWDRFRIKMPIVGSVIERALLARFSRSFSMMLAAGVPLNQALSLVASAVDNSYMAKHIVEMRHGIERGESLLRTATSSELFTPLVLQMVAVGEETGQIEELLNEVADFYEREVDYDLKTLTARIEPILIAVVAGMVLILALGIFTPMWDMMRAVRG